MIVAAAALGLPACNESDDSDSQGGETEVGSGSDGAATGGSGDGTDGAGTDGAGTEGDSDSDGGLPPIDPEICENLSFDNVVDRASCPDIQGRGVDPEFAGGAELCRRAYLDLLGHAPTHEDYGANCAGRPIGEIVDDFMARPGYVELGRRIWADEFLMTSQETYYEYVVGLDALVQALYRGDILLPAFAEQAAIHPGFIGRFDGQDLPGYSFLAFLGRDAAPHERLDLEALWHMWQDRYIENHPEYYFGYSKVVVNTLLCANQNEARCHSDLWGHHSVVLPLPVPEDNDYNGPNVLDLDALTPEQLDILGRPGRLIPRQATFYETAVDKSLLRYLGYKAGVPLPRVRQALVDLLVESDGDIRAMEREILTSQLYRMASAYPDPEGTLEEDGSPDFWHGPMKQMQAEMWLDSVGRMAGVDLGSCDPRFPNVVSGRPEGTEYEETVWHPNEYPKDVDGWPAERNKPNYDFRDRARLLGGCPDQLAQLRFTGTGVMIALAQSDISREVCERIAADAPIVHPDVMTGDGSAANLRTIADHIHKTVLIDDPPDSLDAALSAAADGCAGDAECDPAQFTTHICGALFRSAPFLFY